MIDFDNFCIIETGMNGMNILPRKYKLFNFNLTIYTLRQLANFKQKPVIIALAVLSQYTHVTDDR